jgi:DNA-directed RNA polymerase specialized sigma24 family protein
MQIGTHPAFFPRNEIHAFWGSQPADPVEAELVKLRYFVGLTTEEAAKLLDISEGTARNYWAHARTWLYHEIAVRGAV